jgi:hypothetical protein
MIGRSTDSTFLLLEATIPRGRPISRETNTETPINVKVLTAESHKPIIPIYSNPTTEKIATLVPASALANKNVATITAAHGTSINTFSNQSRTSSMPSLIGLKIILLRELSKVIHSANESIGSLKENRKPSGKPSRLVAN